MRTRQTIYHLTRKTAEAEAKKLRPQFPHYEFFVQSREISVYVVARRPKGSGQRRSAHRNPKALVPGYATGYMSPPAAHGPTPRTQGHSARTQYFR